MKMDKLFAGLIAFAAGVALSAGSAFAANGHMVGDHAMMKLVPYYETGDTRATIIGIQNLSPQEEKTKELNADVKDIQDVLDGKAANANAAGLITGVNTDETLGDPQDPTKKANAEKALAKAKEAAYKEHLFITVTAYDAMGKMMEDAKPATLCLAENQFGVVVLQGAAAMMADSSQMATLSATDGDIPEDGYVQVMAEDRKFTGCGATAPNTLKSVVTGKNAIDADLDTGTRSARSEIATWAIIQDTGDGFFGTEVPSATISMNAKVGDLDTADVACYAGPAQTLDGDGNFATADAFIEGAFSSDRCGLIPERDNNARSDVDSDTATPDTPTPATATPRGNFTVRYDAGDESMIYVWLAAGMDTEKTLPKDERKLAVTVMCEDGTTPPGPDEDGDGQPDAIKVPAPTMLTMIDPLGDDLGQYTDMCEGDRGTLSITMPGKSAAGMAFTHITQMMGHYRMNFPAYNMSGSTACTADNLTSTNAAYNPLCAD